MQHASHPVFLSFLSFEQPQTIHKKKEIQYIYVKIQKNPKHYRFGQQVKEEIAPLLQKDGTDGGRGGVQDQHIQTGGSKRPTEKSPLSSFSHMSIAQLTPDTNVVLLLRHLGRHADADLVEPLVTAAVTLDPIHLQAGKHKFFSPRWN